MGRRKPKVREIDGCDDPLKPHARSPLDVRRQSTNGQAPEEAFGVLVSEPIHTVYVNASG